MNIWTQKSIELANQSNYLDLLYKVYPLSANLRREMSDTVKANIQTAVNGNNSELLLKILIEQTKANNIVFPIKDSYVAYLKHDSSAIKRNPNTTERIAGILYEMGYDSIINKATAPKETNRQIGPLFGAWACSGALGATITKDADFFLSSKSNIIFDGTDNDRMRFATKYLGYTRNKGLDFIAKFNDIYIIAEAKFLSDFGGSQNSDFEDAEQTLRTVIKKTNNKVKAIAIVDGVLYIERCVGNKISRRLRTEFADNEVILSAVLLRDYLYSL